VKLWSLPGYSHLFYNRPLAKVVAGVVWGLTKAIAKRCCEAQIATLRASDRAP
jgi:hypothetical protein